jgi:hypothetical protein
MKYKFTLVFALSFFFVQSQWVKERGTGYYKVGGWSLLAQEHFTDQGKVDPNATRGLFISSFFGQYGLSNSINLIAYVPFFVKNYQFAQVSMTNGKEYEPRQEFNSFGDVNLGIEFQFKRPTAWAFSGTLTIGIPSGRASGGSDGSYQTGDGEFNQLLQLNLGKSYTIGSQDFYFKTYLGFNNRTQGFSDEAHLYTETGTQLFQSKILILSRLHWIRPLYNGTLNASNANGAIFANNIESFVVGGEVAWFIQSNWGLSLGLTTPFFGKVIYNASSFSGGVFLNL